MARYVGHAVDQYGRDIPGAYVTVVGMDGLPATLTDDFGTAISQPLRTDDYGGYYFNTDDGLYTITTTRSGETIAKEYNVVIGILPTTDGFQIALAAEASARVAGDAAVASNAAAALSNESNRAIAAEQAEVTRATGVEQGLDTRLTTAEDEIDDLQTVSNLGGSIPYDTYADAVSDFTAYNPATAYTVGKRALDQGAVWINILAGTGVAPPTLPTTSNANWQLVKNPTAGQAIVIPITDTGSHTDPTTGTTVTNTGIHVWATGTSGTGFHYLYPTDAALAKPYADAAAASATLAGHYANDDTDTDVPGGNPGDRGAKFYSDEAQDILTQVQASVLSPSMKAIQDAIDYGQDFADLPNFVANSMVLDYSTAEFRTQNQSALMTASLSISSVAQSATTWWYNPAGSANPLKKFAANTLRETGLGIIVEVAATNLVTSPDDLTTWTLGGAGSLATGQTAPDGTATAFRITDASTSSFSQISKAFTVPVSVGPFVTSLWIKKEAAGAAVCRLQLSYTGGTAQPFMINFAPDTGASSSTGNSAVSVADRGSWWEIQQARTLNATNASCTLSIYPAVRLNGGTTDTATATGSITVWMPNLEQAAVASSPKVGTRPADAVSISLFPGDSTDVLQVNYSGGSKLVTRSALASANILNLASDVSAPWLGSTITRIALTNADSALSKTVVALRTSAASGGQPTVLPTGSPTITYGPRNGSPTLTGSLVSWNTANAYSLISATWVQAGASFPDTTMGRPNNVSYSADSSIYGGVDAYVEFYHTGDAFEIYQKGYTGSAFRLWVNGQLSANAYPNIPSGSDAAGGLHYTKVDFGSIATRLIRLESLTGVLQFGGVQVKTGQSVSAGPIYSLIGVAVGDSFTEGTGASDQSFGYAPQLMHDLGLGSYRDSGSGGTGWVQTSVVGSITRCNLNDRWTPDVVQANPDLAIVAMGYNDIGKGNDATIQAMVTAKLQELRAARPTCLIHVFGPWDSNAFSGVDGAGNTHVASPPTADCVSLTTAIQNGVTAAGLDGVWFHSMLGIGFQPVGTGVPPNIHPTNAGHVTLERAMYGMLAATHGLRPL